MSILTMDDTVVRHFSQNKWMCGCQNFPEVGCSS